MFRRLLYIKANNVSIMGALKSTIPFGLHPSSLESLKQPASNKQNKQNSTHTTHTTRPVRWCLAYPWCRLKKSALVFWDGVRPRSRITAITADHPQIIVHFSAQPHFMCVIQTITSHLTYPVHNQILFLTDELCLTTTFRRNPPFTWCSVFVEVCRERLRQREAERGWGRERQREAESRSVSDKRMRVEKSCTFYGLITRFRSDITVDRCDRHGCECCSWEWER